MTLDLATMARCRACCLGCQRDAPVTREQIAPHIPRPMPGFAWWHGRNFCVATQLRERAYREGA